MSDFGELLAKSGDRGLMATTADGQRIRLVPEGPHLARLAADEQALSDEVMSMFGIEDAVGAEDGVGVHERGAFHAAMLLEVEDATLKALDASRRRDEAARREAELAADRLMPEVERRFGL
jgi:hypothetical protein